MKTLLPFLILVLIHHFLLTPLIRKRLPIYIGLTAALLILFGVWSYAPLGSSQGPPPPPGQNEMAPPPLPEPNGRGPAPQGRRWRPMRPETSRLIMGLLLVGVDLGAYFYVESRRRERRMKELDFIEHFITLMRLRYPEDAVRIETVFPEDCSGAAVPPLVMASFVENAFKHGISYSTDSFIRAKVELQDGKVIFHCSNSSHPSVGDSRHGIGLDNVRKRLSLLYGNTFTLSTDEGEGRFDVLLSIPSQPEIELS